MEIAIVIGLISLGYGIYAMRKASRIAGSDSNAVDSHRMRRDGRREIITGLILLLLVAPAFYFFDFMK